MEGSTKRFLSSGKTSVVYQGNDRPNSGRGGRCSINLCEVCTRELFSYYNLRHDWRNQLTAIQCNYVISTREQHSKLAELHF